MNRKVIFRTCPFCGKPIARCLKRHLSKHNKTVEDYCLTINNLTSFPKCKNPTCNNLVYFNQNNPDKLYEFCSRECATNYFVITGTHHYLKSNRELDENGKDKITQEILKRGNNPLLSKNRKLDENGKDIIAQKGSETRTKLKLNPFLKENSIKYKIHEKSMLSKSISGKYTGKKTGNQNSVLYIGLFKKEHLIKIGVSRNLSKRLYTYKLSGIEFDEIKTKENIETENYKLEEFLKTKFNKFRKTLNSEIYKNPVEKTFQTLGHTEWFSDEIYNDVLKLL